VLAPGRPKPRRKFQVWITIYRPNRDDALEALSRSSDSAATTLASLLRTYCRASGTLLVPAGGAQFTSQARSVEHGSAARDGGHMNRDTLKGQWTQLKGQVRKRWGKLTDDEIDQIQGDAEILMGKLQERYGYTRDQAQREIDRWEVERKAS
jgi:uncharacterized protein YjbJ (UPF0337 family)